MYMFGKQMSVSETTVCFQANNNIDYEPYKIWWEISVRKCIIWRRYSTAKCLAKLRKCFNYKQSRIHLHENKCIITHAPSIQFSKNQIQYLKKRCYRKRNLQFFAYEARVIVLFTFPTT